ncbi:MAG: molybdopterin-dependent oxidoreductase [Deltaproteobacteria bacterium]|jgi:anaerobic selenocysteine-containing dehydrogenase|nr:molybdopterin-dependent oxidoreductase [Deltaproteobacteria bacterium]
MDIKRRAFIAMAGLSAGVSTGIVLSPLPWKLLDDLAIWTQNWSWIPTNPKGENTYTQSTSKICPSGCGVRVRLLNGRPLRALSNHEHPLGGGISALAAAEPQLMHSPARVRKPRLRGADGKFKDISWAEAEALLLAKIREAGSDVLCLSGDENGSSVAVLSSFLHHLGSRAMYLMPSEAQCASLAWQATCSVPTESQPGYDLESSDFVLAIGANLLESWGTFIRNRRIFAQKRQADENSSFGFVYAGPVQNQSAAVADSWLPLNPAAETVLALGLANLLVTRYGRSVNAPGFDAVADNLSAFTPDLVRELAGVQPRALEELAEKLASASKPLVLCGSEFNQGGGLAPSLAGLLLNLLLRAPITAVPLHTAALPGALSRNEVYKNDFLRDLAKAGNKLTAKLTLFYNANPAYGLPGAKTVAKAIAEAPYKVAITPFMDETAMLCDLVLPDAFGLEKLDDIESPHGCGQVFYGLSRPLQKPLGESRHGLNVLLGLGIELGLGIGLPTFYEDVLKSKAAAMNLNWRELHNGVTFERPFLRLDDVSGLDLTRYESLLFGPARGVQAKNMLTLAPLVKNALGTAQTGIPPFSLKIVRDDELAGQDSFVALCGETARHLGLAAGSAVKVASAQEAVFAKVRIYEGIAPGSVGIYLGFGHTALDEFSRGKGANAFELMIPAEEAGSGLMVWNKTGVTITKA